MKICLEYPNIRELEIQNIEVIDIRKNIIGTFTLQKDTNVWCAILDILSRELVYKFLINHEIYLNDPYSNDYIIKNGEVWSRRYTNHDITFTKTSSIGLFDIVVSNQMNSSVRASKNHKRFYRRLDKRVNVGVEFYSITGIHELLVVWGSPDKRTYHMDYKVIEPQREGESYGIIVWFRMLLDEVEEQLLRGAWTVRILIDGVLIGMEWFLVEESYVEDV